MFKCQCTKLMFIICLLRGKTGEKNTHAKDLCGVTNTAQKYKLASNGL